MPAIKRKEPIIRQSVYNKQIMSWNNANEVYKSLFGLKKLMLIHMVPYITIIEV